MKKRILSLVLVLALVLTMLPAMSIAALAETINDDNVFVKQSESGKCTLASSVMMLRRRAIIDGNANWSKITESTLGGSGAWISGTGLNNNFSYMGMTVSGTKSYGQSSGNKAAFIALLGNHPEGIVIYDMNIPSHAVLLTDYDESTDTFYCADPAVAAKRIKLSESYIASKYGGTQNGALNSIGKIWYITNKSGGGPGLVTVTLDANGGSCSQSTVSVSGSGTITGLPTPTRTGYRFLGWYDAKTGGNKIENGYAPKADMTIYAHWEKIITVTLDANGGSCSQSTVSVSGSGTITGLPTPTRTGYRFLGWYDAKTGGSKIENGYAPKDDMTIYAHWEDLTVRGTCGSGLSWSFNPEIGILGITGSGKMTDFAGASYTPWSEYGAYVTKVEIGSGVQSVGDYAFSGLKNLKSVSCASTVLESLGTGAFSGCSGLASISGFESVKLILSDCFSGCKAITSYTIPEGCTSISSGAFSGTRIETVTVPASVTYIGAGAFKNCLDLETAELPGNLEKIGSELFYGCAALVNVSIGNETNTSYMSGSTIVEANAFYGCTALENISIYNRAEKLIIAKNAFCGCTALTSMMIDCRSLTLDNNALPSGANMYYIRISGSYGSIAPRAFEGVTTTVVYPVNDSSWSENVGKNYGGKLTWEGETGHEHTFKMTVTEPTCSENGYTTFECVECGEKFTDSYKPMLGHNFVGGRCTVCGAENPFTDIDAKGEHIYYTDAILWASGRGITTGASATEFEPDGFCTRAQVVTFLWRAAGRPEPASAVTAFTDIEEDGYYYKAVLWAVENGITTGVSATEFAPDDTCTRAQFVTFLWRYLGKPVTVGDDPFTDLDTKEFYYKAVLWASESGVTRGNGDGTFAPDDNCTRAQVVTFIYRALK